MQSLCKGLLQSLKEGQGSPEKKDLPLDFSALGQAGYGLVHHGLKNAGSDVFFLGPLVDQGLNVRFGKDAAARGDGIDICGRKAQAVQLLYSDI